MNCSVKKVLLFLMMCVTVFGIVIINGASASIATYSNPYDGAWQPQDGSVFAVELTFRSSDASLHIYDFGDTSNNLSILNDGFFTQTNIYFSSENNSDDSVSWFADTVPDGQTLALGADPFFGLYFSDGDTDYMTYNLFGSNGYYLLSEMNTGMRLFLNDAQPVATPIPAAALLLGSGLVGMVALKRRQRQ